MSLITRLTRLTTLRNVLATAQRDIRWISTSQKKSDTATIATQEKTVEDFAKPDENKNWVYWGFETKSKTEDHDYMKSSFFFSITMCLVFGGFVYYYQPDFLMRDWAQREAYLELRRREAAGLDPVNENYVDPATIELPSDEELGNAEIII